METIDDEVGIFLFVLLFFFLFFAHAHTQNPGCVRGSTDDMSVVCY